MGGLDNGQCVLIAAMTTGNIYDASADISAERGPRHFGVSSTTLFMISLGMSSREVVAEELSDQ
jgi:hypothetical protein